MFKVPVSNEGIRACTSLVAAGHRVNVHLVYTLNQAYMAMAAGASFVCPLAGRLEDPEFSAEDMEAALGRLPEAPAIA